MSLPLRRFRIRRQKGFVLPGDQRAASLELMKADSADSVWISLAPMGFAVPCCAAIGYAEPRVGVTAFGPPAPNPGGERLGHALGPAPDRHCADDSAVWVLLCLEL